MQTVNTWGSYLKQTEDYATKDLGYKPIIYQTIKTQTV
jgi:hypothetical protein